MLDLSTYRLTEPEHTPLFLTEKQRLPITLPTREQTIWYRGASCGDRARKSNSLGWQAMEDRCRADGVTLVCAEGTPIALSRSALESLVKEGRIVGVPTATQSSITEAESLAGSGEEVEPGDCNFRNRVIHPEHYHDESKKRYCSRCNIPAEPNVCGGNCIGKQR